MGSPTKFSIEDEKRKSWQPFLLAVKTESWQQFTTGPKHMKFRHWQAQSFIEVADVSASMSHPPGLMVPACWQTVPLGGRRTAAQVGVVVEEGVVVEVLVLGAFVLESSVSEGSLSSECSVALGDAIEVAIVVGTLMLIFQVLSALMPATMIDVDSSSPVVPC